MTIGDALADVVAVDVEAAPRDHGRTCPGVRSDAAWDDTESLRGEIYTADRLSEHAA